MLGCFVVMLGEQPVGQVKVSKEGLYYKFTCTVQLDQGSWYHLIAHSEGECIDLGLCVPHNNLFTVCTRMPAKRFQYAKYDFILSDESEKVLVKIHNRQPFSYIQNLSASRFLKKDGSVYLALNLKLQETV